MGGAAVRASFRAFDGLSGVEDRLDAHRRQQLGNGIKLSSTVLFDLPLPPMLPTDKSTVHHNVDNTPAASSAAVFVDSALVDTSSGVLDHGCTIVFQQEAAGDAPMVQRPGQDAQAREGLQTCVRR